MDETLLAAIPGVLLAQGACLPGLAGRAAHLTTPKTL